MMWGVLFAGFAAGLCVAYAIAKCYRKCVPSSSSKTFYWFSQLRPASYSPVSGDEELV